MAQNKNLSLRDFEFQISPIVWNTAQDLAHQGRVAALREIERHFWVATVGDENGQWETEVIISPLRIKAFACGCWPEQRRLMCVHIAATLLKIRQFLDHKAEEKLRKQAEEASSTLLKRITIRDALSVATPELLLEFTRNYARKDRDFALALVTHFAGLVAVGEENPYEIVVKGLLKPGKMMRDQDLKRAIKSINDLAQQSQHAESQGMLPVVFKISSALLQGAGQYRRQHGNERSAFLHNYFEQALNSLGKLLRNQAASPELKRQTWDALFEAVRSDQIPDELQRDLIRTLSAESGNRQYYALIEQSFFESPSPVPTPLLHLYLAALSHSGLSEGAYRVLEQTVTEQNTADTYREAALQLYYLHYDEAAAFILQKSLDLAIWKINYRHEMIDILINIAERNRRNEWIESACFHRYLLSPHEDTFKKMKEAAGKRWFKRLEKVIEYFTQENRKDKIAETLAYEGDFTLLSAYINQSGDLQLAKKYLRLLPDDQIERIYTQAMTRHLEDHFGAPAIGFLKSGLLDLIDANKTASALSIMNQMKTAFPDREGLPDTLEKLKN